MCCFSFSSLSRIPLLPASFLIAFNLLRVAIIVMVVAIVVLIQRFKWVGYFQQV